jgi:environmental stress-induced protein Ves
MQLTITPPTQFKKVPWKNGKGITTELAINENGTLDNFDWRLSIASVAQNGIFSNFSGYTRNLTLIAGKGIALHHIGTDKKITHSLKNKLDVSIFDGGSETTGELFNGEILDFNVIVKTDSYSVETINSVNLSTVNIIEGHQYFIYCLQNQAKLTKDNNEFETLPTGHLMHISGSFKNNLQITGQMMIIIKLTKK